MESLFTTLGLFKIELGLGILVLGSVLADMFLPKSVDRAKTLTQLSIGGLAILLGVLAASWGVFGEAFGGSYVHDGLSYVFKAIFLVTGIFVLHMASQWAPKIQNGRAEFVVLILLALTGMCLLSSSNELLLFFVSLETMQVSLYVITAYMRNDEHSIEAGVKYVILGALSTAILVFGLSFVYGATGQTQFAGIAQSVAAQNLTTPVHFYLGCALVLIAMFFKIAAFPFHIWVPDVYEGAPAPITAFLALGSKAAGFVALSRLLLTVFEPIQETFVLPVIATLSAATIIYGNFGALNQKNIKRMLAYSSIGHAGYLMVGLAAVKSAGIESVLVYMIGYLFSTAAAFLVVVWLSAKKGIETISDYAGLSQRSPIMAAAMLMAMSSLAGVPPMAGFFGKFYILSAAVNEGLIWLALIGLLNVVTSLYYYLGVIKQMYNRPAEDKTPLQIDIPHRVMLYISMIGIVILGAYPTPAVQLARSALEHIIH